MKINKNKIKKKMLDYISYESLQKIEPQNLIPTTEKINQNISEDTIPIPSRIESINLLRSIHKYQSAFFKVSISTIILASRVTFSAIVLIADFDISFKLLSLHSKN